MYTWVHQPSVLFRVRLRSMRVPLEIGGDARPPFSPEILRGSGARVRLSSLTLCFLHSLQFPDGTLSMSRLLFPPFYYFLSKAPKRAEIFSPEKNRPTPSRDRRSSLFHGWRGPFSPKSKMLRSWRANGASSSMHRPAPGPKSKMCRSCGCAGGVRQKVKKCGQQARSSSSAAGSMSEQGQNKVRLHTPHTRTLSKPHSIIHIHTVLPR